MPDQRRRLAQVGRILGRIGLDPSLVSRRPAELSGGQCQRVAIARAIAVPPRLLLCDEPITAVDVSLAAGRLLNLIGALRREFGMAILFVTHDVAAARYVADRMIVLRRGDGTRYVGRCGRPSALALYAPVDRRAAATACWGRLILEHEQNI
jgi:peptide/nickel transport system ATP-binding protein